MINALYPAIIMVGIPLIGIFAYVRWLFYKEPVYVFSSLIPFEGLDSAARWQKRIPFLLRFLSLLFLLLALARLRVPDQRSKVPVQGIDIMLVFDASGSMVAIDDRSDMRTRIDIAKKEAASFIERRLNDAIGLVLFSGAAVTRCPLTLDKKMLEEVLNKTTVETIPIEGTVLSDGIIVAANRLKKSTASSRIMIVLTDGAPSPQDSDPSHAIAFAKKLGIKIYTIGIGSDQGGWLNHPFFGWQQMRGSYNEELLKRFAQETGGRFFHARNPQDMADIYKTIDALETTEHELPVYSRYFDYFMYFLWLTLLMLLAEIILTSYLWVRL